MCLTEIHRPLIQLETHKSDMLDIETLSSHLHIKDTYAGQSDTVLV